MRLDEFDYDLDKELIAQTPLEKRDGSRLMVLDCKEKKVEDKMFPDLLSYLEKGDTLVLNNTKVLPARLIGEKDVTKAVIECYFAKIKKDIWESFTKPAKRIHVGDKTSFEMVTGSNLYELVKSIEVVGFGLHEGVFVES